nr:twin-arginine translocase TatA/TatE family subunit [uncultured Carboxylicivirga sp.]
MINLLFISGGEILIVGLVVLLLFGAKSIPDVARMLGKGMNEFKRASDEIKRELRDQTSDIRNDVEEARSYVNKEVNDVKKAVNESTSSSDLNKEHTRTINNKVDSLIEKKEQGGEGTVSRDDKIEK